MAKATKISDALQLDGTLRLKRAELPVLTACPVRLIDRLMSLYNNGVGYKFAFLFREGNEEKRDNLLDILYILCDEKYDKEYFLDILTTADESEVYEEINRFLGIEPRNPSTEAQE